MENKLWKTTTKTSVHSQLVSMELLKKLHTCTPWGHRHTSLRHLRFDKGSIFDVFVGHGVWKTHSKSKPDLRHWMQSIDSQICLLHPLTFQCPCLVAFYGPLSSSRSPAGYWGTLFHRNLLLETPLAHTHCSKTFWLDNGKNKKGRDNNSIKIYWTGMTGLTSLTGIVMGWVLTVTPPATQEVK